MERIMKEKISADHLLYVSLKYTKTTDVMLNLLDRWRSMIESSIDRLLEKAKKNKAISSIPEAPKIKIDKIREVYKKKPEILKAMDLLDFFKRVPELEKTREGEFRKNVALKILYRGEWVDINLDKLKEYNGILENFVNSVREIL